ncbi:hypothetical protein [Flavobacterium sp.]|uniref:hypothetical protein n=1 Tax=Flavobacterium sp. TaxID=239 RepID=UPI0025BA02AE|nr:hypothetical protein [Flavobacterium sp.]
MRQLFLDATEPKSDIEKIRKKVDNQSKNIERIFHYFDELTTRDPANRPRIGYKK